MALKKLTNKNFLPSKGVTPLPVYAEYYNDMYDAVYTLNARAHHSMDPSRILKHALMAVAVWDFAVNGGATGTVNLNGGIAIIPDNAIVRNVVYDIATTLVSLATAATATMIVSLPTDGTLVTQLAVTGAAGTTGMGLGTPVHASGGTWIKTTAARGIQVEVTGAGTLTAGKIYYFVEYVVSELEPSGLASL